jgi:hypothetical protein
MSQHVTRTLIVLCCLTLAFSLAAQAAYTFTAIDFPSATLTTATGINNKGDIVGSRLILLAPISQVGQILRDALQGTRFALQNRLLDLQHGLQWSPSQACMLSSVGVDHIEAKIYDE